MQNDSFSNSWYIQLKFGVKGLIQNGGRVVRIYHTKMVTTM
jgi:hypothetical protein